MNAAQLESLAEAVAFHGRRSREVAEPRKLNDRLNRSWHDGFVQGIEYACEVLTGDAWRRVAEAAEAVPDGDDGGWDDE